MTLTAACFVAEPTAISKWYSLSVLSLAHSSLCITFSPQFQLKLPHKLQLFHNYSNKHIVR